MIVSPQSVRPLTSDIAALKEMVVLPLLYPELCTHLNIVPPRGVLFYGPPGTGKTFTARALAVSCSQMGCKVTFYMRKGADILSQWIGEAERQLRLLFEEARRNQPAIIFFDEIDGLAPVRSCKQDQIHNSIVATLLALMDGLDDRGQVIVIGATNRIDSVDPALRRPGRFDREFYFKLPNQLGRQAILNIYTKHWKQPLSPEDTEMVAELTAGYCGADIKALCTEASLMCLRRAVPYLYDLDFRAQIDLKSVQITVQDLLDTMSTVKPANQRSLFQPARPLPKVLWPLLQVHLQHLAAAILPPPPPNKNTGFAALTKLLPTRSNHLIYGIPCHGIHYLCQALLFKVEDYPIHVLSPPTLYSGLYGPVSFTH